MTETEPAAAATPAASTLVDDEEIHLTDADLQRCRFYRKKLPVVGQITKVETQVIKELGANVTLLEYGNIEGFIQMSHMTNKRIRSVHKHLKIGRREFMEVLRVDEEKHYVDLGKKSLKPDEVDEADKRYKKSKKVHEIMIECAIKMKQPIEQLYEGWGWDLYDLGYDNAIDALRVCMQHPETVLPKLNISDEHRDVLMSTLQRKMPLNPFKIRVDFKLTCTGYDGIEVIKEALLTAKHAINDEEWKLDFKLIAPPIYKCEVLTLSRAQGEDKLKLALSIIKKVMKKNGGKFEQSGPPTVWGANKDEQELSELIEMAAEEEEGSEAEGEEDNQEGMAVMEQPEEIEGTSSDDEEEKKD